MLGRPGNRKEAGLYKQNQGRVNNRRGLASQGGVEPGDLAQPKPAIVSVSHTPRPPRGPFENLADEATETGGPVFPLLLASGLALLDSVAPIVRMSGACIVHALVNILLPECNRKMIRIDYKDFL